MNYYKCRDCKRIYDIDVDKCIECHSDDWIKLTKIEYISLLKKIIQKLEN